jgi:hypothetical protein
VDDCEAFGLRQSSGALAGAETSHLETRTLSTGQIPLDKTFGEVHNRTV